MKNEIRIKRMEEKHYEIVGLLRELPGKTDAFCVLSGVILDLYRDRAPKACERLKEVVEMGLEGGFTDGAEEEHEV